MTSTSISVESKIPQDYKNLIWNTFLKERIGVLSIDSHFPWLNDIDSDTWYVILREHDTILGGLAVKKVNKKSKIDDLDVCAIGLVCINPIHRGKGHARRLLNTAIKEAKLLGKEALTLWTQNPDIYRKHGFKLIDDSVFGLLNAPLVTNNKYNYTRKRKQLIEKLHYPKELGLPAFAHNVTLLKINDACITLIQDETGFILADWLGPEDEIIMILESIAEKEIRINAHEGDALLCELETQGWILKYSPSNLQMWLTLNNNLSNTHWPEHFRFSILDRI